MAAITVNPLLTLDPSVELKDRIKEKRSLVVAQVALIVSYIALSAIAAFCLYHFAAEYAVFAMPLLFLFAVKVVDWYRNLGTKLQSKKHQIAKADLLVKCLTELKGEKTTFTEKESQDLNLQARKKASEQHVTTLQKEYEALIGIITGHKTLVEEAKKEKDLPKLAENQDALNVAIENLTALDQERVCEQLVACYLRGLEQDPFFSKSLSTVCEVTMMSLPALLASQALHTTPSPIKGYTYGQLRNDTYFVHFPQTKESYTYCQLIAELKNNKGSAITEKMFTPDQKVKDAKSS